MHHVCHCRSLNLLPRPSLYRICMWPFWHAHRFLYGMHTCLQMFGLPLHISACTSHQVAAPAIRRSIVEVGAYNAVKNATCSKQCLEGGLLQACPAQAPAPAPSPAYAQALAALQAGAPAPGASFGGALNGLSSALQAGSPPRYPSEAVPQVLMQQMMT